MKGVRQPLRVIKRRHILKKHFGMSEDDYNQMFVAQNGVCAICQKPEQGTCGIYRTPRVLAVDHDHETGKVRGLLCHACNAALGLFREDIETFLRAIAYLKTGGTQ